MEATREREPLLGPRLRERPRPSFTDALGVGGGLLVLAGALFIAFDLLVGDGEGDPNQVGPAMLFLALLLAACGLLFVLPEALKPAAVTVTAGAVPGVFGFLLLVESSDPDDVRAFLLCTILAWIALFIVPRSRGRAVYVAASALLLYAWVVGEVAGFEEAYSISPVPSPVFASPGELYEGMQGRDLATITAEPALARPAQVTLDDLDRDDPLYPLAEDCADGDADACDELYASSPFGSDFEEFGSTCGGRDSESFGFCGGTDDFGDDLPDGFPDDLGDDFGDDFSGEFETPTPSFGTTGFGTDDKALEIGLVSALFAAAYLGAAALLDRRRWAGLATAFVLPGLVALLQAVGALGAESESAIVGGLLTMIAGIVFGIVGWYGERRFAAWAGGIIASIGAAIIAGDIADPSVGDDGTPDFVGTGIILILFGVAVVALAFGIWWLLQRRDTGGPDVGAGPGPSGPDAPFATAPAPEPAATPPAAPAPSAWAPPPAPPDPQH